tara:strand:+ start:123 stop:239 length:117 start_codon:yes stop_codon:yes gene_type:complete
MDFIGIVLIVLAIFVVINKMKKYINSEITTRTYSATVE